MLQVALLLLAAQAAFAHFKPKGKHMFPLFNSQGTSAVNEFQLLEPEKIVDRTATVAASSYQITSVSPTLIDNDDVVTVTFSSSTPSGADWIGAYSSAGVNISATVPVKFGWCDEDENYLTTGKGMLTFNLTNLRDNVGFFYFTNGLSSPILMFNSSQVVNFRNINQPLRPRVVPTGDYDVYKLLWSSANSKTPMLQWGTKSGVYTYTSAATTSTIDQTQLCGYPAAGKGWRDLGLIHTATLEGMSKLGGTTIYYRFGDVDTNDFSQEYPFVVPPMPGTQPKTRPTRAILFDDLGRGSTDLTYTWNEYGRPALYTVMGAGAEVAAGEIDVIYHGGDISYATGYEAVWDFYLDMIGPIAASTLYLTTVGNHESDWYNTSSYYSNSDSGGECGVLTTTLIPMPEPATTNQPWWSYDVGLFHFVGMSTEHNYTFGSPQYYWIENDLANVDRTKTPWVIFGGHRAMYVNSDYGGTVNSDITVMNLMIANIEPLLYKYKVNFGFYGHNHVVQRHAAVLNSTVIQHATKQVDSSGHVTWVHDNPQATVQLVIGSGGATFTKNAVVPPPDWNELFYYEYGYARLTAVNASYLDYQWVRNTDGAVLDHMVIIQDDPSAPFK